MRLRFPTNQEADAPLLNEDSIGDQQRLCLGFSNFAGDSVNGLGRAFDSGHKVANDGSYGGY